MIERAGASVPHSTALTIDDGRDSRWAQSIRDTLKARGVNATFIIIGENALREIPAACLLFLLMDWLAAVIAFLLEPGEERRLTWLILIQRFAYWQIMYWVVVKSFVAAARGGRVGWGSPERKGTVAAQRG